MIVSLSTVETEQLFPKVGLWVLPVLNSCTAWPAALSWLVGVGVVLVVGNDVVLAPVVAIVLFYLVLCIFFPLCFAFIPFVMWCLCNPGRLMALLIQSRVRFELFSGSANGFSLYKKKGP